MECFLLKKQCYTAESESNVSEQLQHRREQQKCWEEATANQAFPDLFMSGSLLEGNMYCHYQEVASTLKVRFLFLTQSYLGTPSQGYLGVPFSD